MLLPSAEVPATPGPRAAADVIVVVTGRDRGHVARALALASRRRAVLHLVAPSAPPWSPWAVLLGARPGRGAAVAAAIPAVIAQAAAAGVHVEVHRAPGRLHALAAGIAETVGGQVVRSRSRQTVASAGSRRPRRTPRRCRGSSAAAGPFAGPREVSTGDSCGSRGCGMTGI